MRIAFQGFRGAYSEAAGHELFGPTPAVELVGHATVDACFQAVSSGQCDYAILPMENTMGGSISDNYDLQLKYALHSVAEVNKRVQHALLALPGTRKADVKVVASHPQALSQCAHYLETQMKHAEPHAEADTAGSARKIADEKLEGWAAICSKAAAKVYGLAVIDEDIQDAKDNITRFLLYARQPVDASTTDAPLKASLVFTIGNRAGALHQALAPFAKYNVNLTKLESRPDRRRDATLVRDAGALALLYGADYLGDVPAYVEDELALPDEVKFKAMFFVDVTLSEGARAAFRELAMISPFVRVLGVYAAGGPLLGHVAAKLGVAEGTSFTSSAKSSTAGAAAAGSAGVVGAKKAKTDSDSNARCLKIAIVGFGNFGQFLAKQMRAHGHSLAAWSRSRHDEQASKLDVTLYASIADMLTAFHPDVVLICTSILSFHDVVASIPSHLLGSALVVDVLSVKVHARKVLLDAWGALANVDIVCTHPMFGPESGRYSWRGLPFVYERTRVNDHARCDEFLQVFKRAGCRMIEMSCEEHDAKAANSQFVTHFTGRSLAELALKPTGIDTKGFASLLDLVENTIKDSDDLFLALYRHNPMAAGTLDQLRGSVEGVSARLKHAAAEPDIYRIADALGRVQPSKTVKTHAAAMELQRKGADVITTLTVGEPHFGAPEPALLAAEACLRSKTGTKYTAVGGTPELRRAICADYAKRKAVTFDPDTEVLVSGGGKQSIFQAVHATCGPGDQVVIPAPYWVSYPDIAALAGAKPVIVQRQATHGYILQPSELRAALCARTRVFILNNPCNPTGCLYTRAQLEALAAVLREPQFAHVLVLSDEIYERVVFDGLEHVSFAALDGMRARTLVVNGVAKGFAMTGMRIGWLCGPTKIVKACEKLQGQISSCACSVSQAAAAAALPLDPVVAGPGKANLDGLLANRELAFGLLGDIKGLVTVKGGGAFYAFCSVRKPDGSAFGLSGEELCERLIRRAKGVAFVPGEAFGATAESCSFRMSYAAEPEHVREGVARLADFVREYRQAQQ